MNYGTPRSVKVSADILESEIVAGILYKFGEVADSLDVPMITILPKKDDQYEIIYTTRRKQEVEKIRHDDT